jgi:uncharacterized membrane protein
MLQKLLSGVLVLSLLALAGCVVAPAPARHGRVYKHRVAMKPMPVVVRPGPVVIVP